MGRHRLEVADVFRKSGLAFLDKYQKSLSFEQHRALRAIMLCRTNALGGHVQKCSGCGHVKQAYNSCRNRHCPKCQAKARADWMDARAADLLPVPYFHVVFTLPEQLGPIALQNPRTVYGILFRAAWETLSDLTRDPKHLGAKIGMLAVLHTWGQNLMHHPHVHCVVPGGGISLDGKRWVRAKGGKKKFFLPVRVVSRVFRGKFIQHLKAAHKAGSIQFHGRLKPLRKSSQFEQLLNASVKNDWIVFCKRPFGGPRQVLKYLARYTHRVAIANSRLLEMTNDRVRFQWKDYRDGHSSKTMELSNIEFMRRFLLHVLPSGFVRIRHFGFLSNLNRDENIQRCRKLLGVNDELTADNESSDIPEATCLDEADAPSVACPECQLGQLIKTLIRGPIVGLSTRRALRLYESGLEFQDSS